MVIIKHSDSSFKLICERACYWCAGLLLTAILAAAFPLKKWTELNGWFTAFWVCLSFVFAIAGIAFHFSDRCDDISEQKQRIKAKLEKQSARLHSSTSKEPNPIASIEESPIQASPISSSNKSDSNKTRLDQY
ncbi:hypothetical protein [Lacticaseibacillus jixiensis]|uniref:hypothetical protein n=1 Tax=Lacticaseibacillus jixiensis TaxID=3231926 RepID=UPI0036F2F7FA